MPTTLPEPFTVNGRYEITEKPLGEGGMGVVYKAYDVVTKRFVALKTMWADASPAFLEQFERDSNILARVSHPNIVDILDTGEAVFFGQHRPYLVMPLLPGRTLEEILAESGDRLSVERSVDLVSQACRGLQSAHDQNIVHRDLRPSNIFVMDDDTVKIIDFGVVPVAGGASALAGRKETSLYMSPEQLEMKPATPLSDIFSLAVICYEILTGRKPFARPTAAEIAEAIRSYVPAAASEIDTKINPLVSRTVHKAMAKQPWHRFSNAREFGDTLQKALRNEPIERFEASKILPRIDRVKKAYSEGDYQFALEILKELESEGHVDSDMSTLHIQIEQALRQKTIRQLLENAKIRRDEEEFPLALNKVADVMVIDPGNHEAQALKEQIERLRDERQVSQWFRLVREDFENNRFSQARSGLEEILRIDSSNTDAREMLARIDQTEHEIVRSREEKQRLYENAVSAYRSGETGTALTHLDRALAIARRTNRSSTPDLDSQVQTFYDSIRDERDIAQNAYQQGRNYLVDRNVAGALEICEEYLQKHPGDPRFQALQLEAEEIRREDFAAAIAEINRRVDAEPDLDQKHTMLREAVAAYPNEPHFSSALKLISDRRDLVHTIVSRARQYEDRGQYEDAASQLDILRNIYPLYPALDSELQRIRRRKEEQVRAESKARWVEQIDSHLNMAEYEKALASLPEALAAFPADADLLHRQSLCEQAVARNAEAGLLLKQGQDQCAARNYTEGLDSLRKAVQLDARNPLTRAALLSGLVTYARELMPNDWHAAEPVVKEALNLEPSDPVARSLLSVLEDNRRHTAINIILAGARNYQTDGHVDDALQIIKRGLAEYPNDPRLIQFFNTLRTLPPPPPPPPTVRRLAPAARLESAAVNAVVPEPAVQQAEAPPPPTKALPPEEPSIRSNRPQPFPPPQRDLSLVWTPPRGKRRDPEPQGLKRSVWVVATLTALAVILSASLYQLLRGPVPPPADARAKRVISVAGAARYPVSLESNVPGTRFTEAGETLDSVTDLSAGIHNVEASREGYLAELKTFSVEPAANAPQTVTFSLRPALPLLRLNSSIAHGKLLLDESESLELEAGEATKSQLSPGPHTVKIYDGTRPVFSFAFNAKQSTMPVLVTPLGAQPAPGAVISSLSGAATIYTTSGLRASTAPPVAVVPPFGLPLAGSVSSPAHFFLDTGKARGPQEQSVDPSDIPTLTIQLAGAPDVAHLAITANVPNCQTWIDGKPLKQPIKGLTASLPMGEGSHAVRLTCPGYQALEKSVSITAGVATPPKLDFALVPVAVPAPVAPPPPPAAVRHAQFLLQGAPPDTPVFQNQIRIGTVSSDGTFSKEIDPGTFTFEWRKPGYQPRKETRTVAAGDSVRMDGVMTPLTGTLQLTMFPDNAHVSVRSDSDNRLINAPTNGAILLAPGSYHVTAAAPEYQDRTEPIVIAAGKPLSLAWTLEKSKVVTGPQRLFENGDSWKPAPDGDGWWVHSGSGYSSLRASTGVVNFDFLRTKHFRKIVILADCPNQNNCFVYSIDGHSLSAKVLSGGRTTYEEKKPHGMDNNPALHLVFEMTPDAIVVKNRAGQVLSSLDRRDPHGKLSVQDDTPLNVN